ncbi:GNAT family N-acetyltransferase [Streptomyces sp. EN23]|uniref:GNAT family N-acetyltransferase n=1 Tax=Streptomyces sp. EN23 TaxID=212774 RepID=UPI000A4E95F2|nr:GNAT family N-acetyltransferase [Streptomyces sp. EN23]
MPTTRRVETLHSVDDIGEAQWSELTGAADIDADRRYLRFREHLEPGQNLLVTVRSSDALRGALHGALTTPATGLASNPFKLLGSEAMLRLDADGTDGGAEAVALRRRQRDLARGAAGQGAGDDEPNWQALARDIGSCFVVRGFDRSELFHAPDTDEAERERTARELVGGAQQAALAQGAGAVAFPFVPPGDHILTEALTAHGFRRGVVTGASSFVTDGCGSYEEYLGRLPSRRRRQYRSEEKRIEESGLLLREVNLIDQVDRISDLEAQTLAKHGGRPDPLTIARARTLLGSTMPDEVRVPAVEDDGRIIACALHLMGPRSSMFMAYGCDYAVEDRSTAYPWACFYRPVRTAIENGIGAVRLGLEGFEAKARRGAVVEPRVMWFWTPDAEALDRIGRLLELLQERNLPYLQKFAG